MNILITGGAGYIGSHANYLLKKKGLCTFIVDDLSDGNEESLCGQELFKININDRQDIFEFFESHKIDAVFHFAAKASVDDSVRNPEKYYQDNVVGMKNILDAMVKTGVSNIVFSSSAATYGEPQEIPIVEDNPKLPINPYGVTKFIGEEMLRDYETAYGIKSVSFRFFNASGAVLEGSDEPIGEAHNPERHIIPLILRAILNGTKFELFGDDYDTKDGTCLRDYVHVLDIAHAHFTALLYLQKGGKSEVFNLGSNQGFTNLEIIKKAEEVSKMKLNYEVKGRRAGDPSKLLASNEKVKNILHFEFKYSDIDTVIKSAWNWERNRRY